MKTKADKRKITVQLWSPLLKRLNEITAAACLNRDAYLDVVFAHEAPMLLNELQGKRNSDQARAFLKQRFAELKELHPVSFTLTAKTANALTAACDQINVWRDAFVNRVIFLLVAKSSAVEEQFNFDFRNHIDAILDDVRKVDQLLFEPRLSAIRSFIRYDPFLAIRSALDCEYPDGECRLHNLQLGDPLASTVMARGLAGFTVYLEDKDVPGTAEYKHRPTSDELLGLLDDDEVPATHEGSK